jgi:hypothetical protein
MPQKENVMGRSSTGYLASAAAAAAVSALTCSGAARAAEPTTAELMQQIQQLQAKVEQLETTQNQQATMSAKEVDATVERVLNDAEKRSQLLQMEGFTAGYNKGKFIVQDAAGNFVLHPYLQFQFRENSVWREDAKSDGSSDDWQNGFEVRRMKFGFDGNAITPNLKYTFQWQTKQSTGNPFLEDGWVSYKFADQWTVQLGQFKGPTFREALVSSVRQLAVERSLQNQLLEGGDDYLQGVALIYDPSSTVHAVLAFTDGFNTINQDFLDYPTNSFDFGFAGRVDWQLMGENFKSYNDYSAVGNKNVDLLVLGAGFDWSESGDLDQFRHTVDAQWEPSSVPGLALFGAYVGRYSKVGTSAPGGDDSFYDWGFLVQAGYMLNDKFELFGRYDYTDFDSNSLAAGTQTRYCEITAGMNYYFSGDHSAKFTLDVTYLPEGSPSDALGADILAAEGNEVVVRGQFQLLL